MRIAYFCGTFQPEQDGVSRTLYRLMEGLNAAGHHSVVFAPTGPTEGVAPERQPSRFVKVPSVALPGRPDYRLSLPTSPRIEQVLRAFRPDLIHLVTPDLLGLSALRLARRHRLPLVGSYHTHFVSYAPYYGLGGLSTLGWSYLRHVYGRCDRVLVPSQPMAEELTERGIGPTTLWTRGVDPVEFSPTLRSDEWRRRVGADPDSPVALHVGRLVWEKDLRTLADAHRRLRTERPDLRWVIVGDGPARVELEAQMPGALFLGHCSGRSLGEAYASSDLLVFPSRTETFGNVVLEAMASGLPAVVAAAGGPLSLVADCVTGFHTPPGDADAVADAVRRLVDDPARRRMGEAALARSVGYRWPEVHARLFADYQSAIERHRFAA